MSRNILPSFRLVKVVEEAGAGVMVDLMEVMAAEVARVAVKLELKMSEKVVVEEEEVGLW